MTILLDVPQKQQPLIFFVSNCSWHSTIGAVWKFYKATLFKGEVIPFLWDGLGGDPSSVRIEDESHF